MGERRLRGAEIAPVDVRNGSASAWSLRLASVSYAAHSSRTPLEAALGDLRTDARTRFGHDQSLAGAALRQAMLRTMNLSCLFSLLLACAVGEVGAATHAALQSDASFAAAIENQSTAPSYVLITEVDGNTGKSQQTCVTANLLIGAIHLENELGDDAHGRMTAIHIALTTPDHVFRFTKQTALQNIPRYYSDDQLAQVRNALKALPEQDLRDAKARESALWNLGEMPHNALRDATACVLIERGLSPGMGDFTDQLWVRP